MPAPLSTPAHIVLVSGGPVSTTLLAQVVRDHPGTLVVALTYRYRQPFMREVIHAQRVCQTLGVGHLQLDIPAFGLAPLLIPPLMTYSPPHGRSATFLAIGTLVASLLHAQHLWAGFTAQPLSPDTPEGLQAVAHALSTSQLTIHLPFLSLTIPQVADLAREIHAPIHLSYPCLTGRPTPCGQCNGCWRAKPFAGDYHAGAPPSP